MTSKPRKTPDHISFIVMSISLIGVSQALEMSFNTPIVVFLRGICISLAFFCCSAAIYLYNKAPKV